MLTHASLFSGIGGFDLAAEWMGLNNLFHCEWNPFGQKVLKQHFPNSISYNDITKTDFTIHRGQVDILSGGFPCQPYSTAGKRLGKEDERHLWPEMLRTIREVKPSWVVGENVRGLINWNEGLVFHEVQSDLEAEGYEIQPFLIPAAGVNAPHQRYRIWFVAYSNNNAKFRNSIISGFITNTKSIGQEQTLENKELERGRFRFSNKRNIWDTFPSKPALCGGNDGLPKELDGITFPKWRNESIKAYGNAIVPQVAFNIFKSINEYEKLIK